MCATPIGNLEDMTFRAVRILREVDLIAAEDTRNSIKLLNHFDIHTPMTSYHEYNKFEKGRELTARLQEGKNIALITDAGMPGISDPGSLLVRKCHDLDVPVSILPGPNAALSALVLSGLDTADFAFFGFLPPKKAAQKAFLKTLVDRKETLLFYESPKRIQQTLDTMREVFGNRNVAILRELSKIHEEGIYGTLEEMSSLGEVKGECVIVVDGAKESALDEKTIRKEIRELLASGNSVKDISKELSQKHGLKKSEVYSLALTLSK